MLCNQLARRQLSITVRRTSCSSQQRRGGRANDTMLKIGTALVCGFCCKASCMYTMLA